jgi:hypothetical protein
MEKTWVRYEGHGNPVCPECASFWEDDDEFWFSHSYRYEPADYPEVCHGCGAPAPK